MSYQPPGTGYGPGPGYGLPGPYGYRPAGPPPASRLGWAITALILFWPLAIPAFIYSSRVETAWYAGDVEGAQRASNNAKTCGVVALVIGILMAVLMIVLFAAVFSATSSSTGAGVGVVP